uniref:Uncharacterized protein n=1 Tax=Siphoviridae sp. ctkyp1 TaxID=2825646 RepID=A0A8S5P3L3_9CAUD|nr:MAG TPA: hypothetical protein [Siphoviridae sp. ctkyp1]
MLPACFRVIPGGLCYSRSCRVVGLSRVPVVVRC